MTDTAEAAEPAAAAAAPLTADAMSALLESKLPQLLEAQLSPLLAKLDSMEKRNLSQEQMIEKQKLKLSAVEEQCRRLEAIEKQNQALEKTVAEENAKLIKLMSTRFTELSGAVAQQKGSGGFFGKTKSVSPGPVAGAAAGGNDQVESKVDQISKRLTLQDPLLKRIEDSVVFSQKKLEMVDNKLFSLETKMRGVEERAKKQEEERKQKATDMDTTNDKDLEVKTEDTSSSSASSVAAAVSELLPKISSLQTNLDMLLTGENEANAVMDKLLPTVARLQEDVAAMAKKEKDGNVGNAVSGGGNKELKEAIDKVQERLDECLDEVDKTREVAEGCKSYIKENLDLSEEIREKIRKPQFVPPHRHGGGGPRYSESAKQYAFSDDDEDKDKSSDRDKSEKSERSASESRSGSVVKLDSNLKSQLIHLHEKIDSVRNEVRRSNVLDILEEKVVMNVYHIRKRVDEMAFGGPPHMMMGPGGMRGGPPMRGRRFFRGPPHYNRYDERPPRYHRGGGPGGERRYYGKMERWTYDEDGNCEQKSDDEDRDRGDRRGRSRSRSRSRTRSRSPRSRSRSSSGDRRSRSRSRDSDKNHRRSSSKHHHRDRDHHQQHGHGGGGDGKQDLDMDFELDRLNKKLGKVSSDVDRIFGLLEDYVDRMDGWREYSKDSLERAKANVDLVGEKVGARVEENLQKLVGVIDSNLALTKAALEASAGAGGGGGGKVDTSELVKVLEEKLCEFGSLVESVGTRQSEGLDELNKEMLQNVKNLKLVKKSVDAYSQSGLKMAELQMSIEAAVKDVQRSGAERTADVLLPRLEALIKEDGGVKKSPTKHADPRMAAQTPGAATAGAAAPSPVPAPLAHDAIGMQIFNRLNDIHNAVRNSEQEVKRVLTDKLTETKNVVVGKDQEMRLLINGKEQAAAKSLGEVKGKLGEVKTDLAKSIKYSQKAYAHVDEMKKTLNGNANGNGTNSALLEELKKSDAKAKEVLLSEVKALGDAVRENREEIKLCESNLKEDLRRSSGSNADSKSLLRLATQLDEVKKLVSSAPRGGGGGGKQQGGGAGAVPSSAAVDEVLSAVERLSQAVDQNRAFVVEIREENSHMAGELRGLREDVEKVGKVSTMGGVVAKLDLKLTTKLEELRQAVNSTTSADPASAIASPRGGRGRGGSRGSSSSPLRQQASSSGSTPEDLRRVLALLADFSPRLEAIEDAVTVRLLRDIGKLNVPLEQIMLNSTDTQDKRFEAVESQLRAIHEEFPKMEARLAVVRKYAKHNPDAEDCLRLLKEMRAEGGGVVVAAAEGGAPAVVAPGGGLKAKDVSDAVAAALSSLDLPTATALSRQESALAEALAKLDALKKDGADDRDWLEEQFEATVDVLIDKVCGQHLRQAQAEIVARVDQLDKAVQNVGKSSGGPSDQAANKFVMSSDTAPVLIQLEETQRQCLGEVRGMRERWEKKEETLTEITTLMELIHRLEAKQNEESDNNIQFQSKFNEDLSRLLESIDSLNTAVIDRRDRGLDVEALPDLCDQVYRDIKALGDHGLARNSSVEFPRMVQQCVQYLTGLLEGDGAAGGEAVAAGVATTPAADNAAAEQEEEVADKDTVAEEESTAKPAGEDEEEEEEVSPPTLEQQPPAKRRGRPPKKAAEEATPPSGQRVTGRSKRGRPVNYNEEEEDDDDDKPLRPAASTSAAPVAADEEMEEEEGVEGEEEEEEDDKDSFAEETEGMLRRMKQAKVRLDKVKLEPSPSAPPAAKKKRAGPLSSKRGK